MAALSKRQCRSTIVDTLEDHAGAVDFHSVNQAVFVVTTSVCAGRAGPYFAAAGYEIIQQGLLKAVGDAFLIRNLSKWLGTSQFAPLNRNAC